MKTWQKISCVAGGTIGAIAAVVILKTATYDFKTLNEYTEPAVVIPNGFDKNIKRFSDAIKIGTISSAEYADTNFKPFNNFSDFLEESYPTVHKNTTHYKINEHVLVYKWAGTDSSLSPIMFNSHYDVVPVGEVLDAKEIMAPFDIANENPIMPTANPTTWSHPPFSGAVENGRIYGRGTLDMKGMLISVMDSAESLMARGFVPKRDIYFVFGHDEENGSANGAKIAGAEFKAKGIMFDAIFDEGGIIAIGKLKDKQYAAALVGVSEKGFITLQLNVRGTGGHSSMPSANSALGNAAVIMTRLQENQYPARILPVVQEMFKSVGGALPAAPRVLIANQWLFKNTLIEQLSKNATANAMIRTSTALTQAFGSEQDNVLPPVAKIVVNFRIQPGDKIDDVIKHVEKLCDGYDVDIQTISRRDSMAVSDTDSHAYNAVKKSIAKIYPGIEIVPYVMLGGTDSKNYAEITKNVYRFMPVILTPIDQRSIHNYDESITINNYYRMVSYFTHFMENYDAAK